MTYKKTCIINEKLWEKIFGIYGSDFAAKKNSDNSIQAYRINYVYSDKMPKYEEIAIQEELNNSEVDYLQTEKSNIFPMKNAIPTNAESTITIYHKACTQLTDRCSHSLNKKIDLSINEGNLHDCAEISEDLDKTERNVDCFQKQTIEPKGLKNYGDNCYVNAGLQSIMCIPEMNAYFLGEKFDEIQHTPKKRGFKICNALSALYQTMIQETDSDWVSPKKFANLLPPGQQDTHEFFLKKLFPHIQDETNPDKIPERKADLNSEKSWKWYRENHNSIVDVLFSGQYEGKVVCESCNNISTTYDPFLDISLPVSGQSLEKCLQTNFKDEIMNTEEAYKCPKCNTVTSATKEMRIDRLPKYLILHLKRLITGNKKISTYIKYPEELNISEYSIYINKLYIKLLDFAQKDLNIMPIIQ